VLDDATGMECALGLPVTTPFAGTTTHCFDPVQSLATRRDHVASEQKVPEWIRHVCISKYMGRRFRTCPNVMLGLSFHKRFSDVGQGSSDENASCMP